MLKLIGLLGKPLKLRHCAWRPCLGTTTKNRSHESIPSWQPRDGLRFLMLKSVDEEQGSQQIVVVQNWLEELRKRMAAEEVGEHPISQPSRKLVAVIWTGGQLDINGILR
jgi:hypothetical protein